MNFVISEKFNLYHKDKISEKKTKVFFYEHKKTKAKVLFYECENVNSAFSITFKTPVFDSKGTTHILEHMVFEGSRKYPEKANFDYMLNNSLASFLNAATWQDKTNYTFASSFKKDFMNLLDVYLDFTFFPILNENTFKREGYFYSKDGESYKFNGIVFNEMKDSLLGYDRRSYFDNIKHLFPGSTYSHLQGGDPVEIVDLNVQDIRDYHKNYYHPSNAYVIIYGKIDKKKVFHKLDEYFSEFEFKKFDFDTDLSFLNEEKEIEDYYQDYIEDDRICFSKSILFDKVTFEEEIALGFLIDLLFRHEFSPMKRALEDSGLINGIYSSVFENDNTMPYFRLELKSIQEKDIPKINEIFETNLKKLSKKIDKEIKETVYKKLQFKTKEFNFYQNQGVDYINISLTRFVNGENPAELIKTLKILKIIKKYIKGKKLENLLHEKFLKNHKILNYKLKPSSKLLDEYKEKIDLKLEERLKVVDTKKLNSQIEEFEKWKEISKKDHIYKNQKKITSKDLEVSVIKYDSKYEENIYTTIVPSEDITRVGLLFDISKIDLNKLEYLSIYLYILNYISTKNYNFDKFTILKSKYLSKISIDVETYIDEFTNKHYLTFSISTKYLNSDFDKILHIFDELINNINFSEKERMKYLINEYYEVTKNKLDSGFKSYARTYLNRFTSQFGDFYEGIEGISLIKKLKNISMNFNNEYDNLTKELNIIHKFIFSSKMLVNLGTSSKHENTNISDVKKLIKKFNLNLVSKDEFNSFADPNYKVSFDNQNFYLQVNSDTNFNFLTAKYEKFPLEVKNILSSANDYLSQYANENIRFQNGAYGARAGINRKENVLTFVSWSDPFINESFKIFSNFKKNFDVSKFVKSKFEKLKRQNIAEFKNLQTNSQIVGNSFTMFMYGRSNKDREQTLHDIKSMSYLDFKKLFELFKKPKFIIKLICTNKTNIKNFKEKYSEIKAF